jgi:hypothetical protein
MFDMVKSIKKKIFVLINMKIIVLVIDFCLSKEMVCDPETNYSCLQLVWASKANCDQRRGLSFFFLNLFYL